VRTLPRDAVKVLLGDNLAAHLSPYVLKMCEVYNIRYQYQKFSGGTYFYSGTYDTVPNYVPYLPVRYPFRYQYLPLPLYCHLYNFLFSSRFVFLPEKCTHQMQALDVAVFAPMKRRWRQILSNWKERCEREGSNFAALPKQDFPALLKELMLKEYTQSIRSEFECCGLYPMSL
jgi:hypothetical protein